MSVWVLIFYTSISSDMTFPLVQNFYSVTLTLEFDVLFENFNLVHNFSTLSARVL